MPQLTHKGYTFKYDANGVYPIRSHGYNFTEPNCMEALEMTRAKQAKFKANAARDAYVYLGKGQPYGQPKPLFKIGSAYDPETRYSDGMEEIIHTIKMPNRKEAFAFEANLLFRFKQKRVSGEWFNLSEDDIAEIISM